GPGGGEPGCGQRAGRPGSRRPGDNGGDRRGVDGHAVGADVPRLWPEPGRAHRRARRAGHGGRAAHFPGGVSRHVTPDGWPGVAPAGRTGGGGAAEAGRGGDMAAEPDERPWEQPGARWRDALPHRGEALLRAGRVANWCALGAVVGRGAVVWRAARHAGAAMDTGGVGPAGRELTRLAKWHGANGVILTLAAWACGAVLLGWLHRQGALP